jgi:hypothetical protein
MRLAFLSCLLLALAGICVAQDTNFSVGPQYLMNFGSPLFLQPIATPSLSFAALPAIPAPEEAGGNAQSYTANPQPQNQVDLFPIYYGVPDIGVVEITSTEPPRLLPESILNYAVEVTNARSLRERGYGVTIAEAAAFWKANKKRASHVYTNADIARLNGG